MEIVKWNLETDHGFRPGPGDPAFSSDYGEKENILFYDIETTGLSPARGEVYLIGTVVWEGDSWQYTGYFSEKDEDESEVLCAFMELRERYPVCVQYNGNSFDRPFLQKRCAIQGLPFSSAPEERDLYREFSPLKTLLDLPSMKQTDLERLLSVTRQYPEGKDCLRLYKAWKRQPDPVKKEMLIGHNREDLKGLLLITRFSAYLQLYHGEYRCRASYLKDNDLQMQIELCGELPLPFRFEGKQISAAGEKSAVHLEIPIRNGRLRQYYPDYENYVYLPSEDTAITKSVGQFLEKSLRRPADPTTCYTWFPVTREFLMDRTMQEKYLKQSLPILLSLKQGL